jgi:sodium-dependent dicarboxylate transporter 2/3/5
LFLICLKAAQNMVAVGFIEKTLQKRITWLEWLIAAAPFSVLMSITLYFVMTRMMPPEVEEVPGGAATPSASRSPSSVP